MIEVLVVIVFFIVIVCPTILLGGYSISIDDKLGAFMMTAYLSFGVFAAWAINSGGDAGCIWTSVVSFILFVILLIIWKIKNKQK